MTDISSSTLARVNRAVREVVAGAPVLATDPKLARRIEQRILSVSLAAAALLEEEARLTDRIRKRPARPMASALANAPFQPAAATSAASVLKGARDAIDFPGFVTSLISGVFQSIQSSNIQQLQAFVDLMDAITGSASDFAQNQILRGKAAQWAIAKFGVFEVSGQDEELELTVKDDAEMPSSEQLKQVLGATDDEIQTIDEGDLAGTLLPIVQRKLARDRQSMLATMVMMGLQRIVVDDGSIHASMKLDVDARSIAEQRHGEQLDTRVSTEASGSFGVGAWGASAKLSATVGYVRSDDQVSREEVAVSAGLRSSVDVRFRTVPLDTKKIANDRTLDQIRGKSLVPEAERAPGSLLSQSSVGTTQRTIPAPAAAPEMGTMAAAEKAREEARKKEEAEKAKKEGKPADVKPADAKPIPKPADPNAANKPADPNAANKPADPNAANKPADPNAANKPADPNAANKPADPNAAVAVKKP
jgi:hypothetical protein